MILSDENIKEFQRLHKEHFGTEISAKDARENGIKLLRLIALLYRQNSQKETVEVEKAHNDYQPNDQD